MNPLFEPRVYPERADDLSHILDSLRALREPGALARLERPLDTTQVDAEHYASRKPLSARPVNKPAPGEPAMRSAFFAPLVKPSLWERKRRARNLPLGAPSIEDRAALLARSLLPSRGQPKPWPSRDV